ncbi:MAG: DUF4291 domain-containing protein [Ruminococcus sp.]|nr:DUF4291 domain-containing protein [Ruminococcus sp.]
MKRIKAVYDEKTIRVYQAYNDRIADEALKIGTFGKSFKRERMTWIKTSFLWIMYRSGWAEKENQERILAIDIKRTGFEEILRNAVLSSYSERTNVPRETWQEMVKNSDVRCQFDPDRDIFGNPQKDRAIQLGLRGKFVCRYIDDYIVKISDITPFVRDLKQQRDEGFSIDDRLPKEIDYPVDEETVKILGMEE